MTALDETTSTTHPGWLRRSWQRHLETGDRRWRPPPDDVDHLLESAIPDILEPFVDWSAHNPGMDDHKILWLKGVDARAAAALLAHLPMAPEVTGWSSLAPSPESLLRAVARSTDMTCGGDLASPCLGQPGLRLWSLLVRDPLLLDVEPDVVPDGLPEWLDQLPAEAYADYLDDRQHCLDHGRTRAAWTRIAARHDIRDGRRFPVTDVKRDLSGAARGVEFLW